MIEDIPFFLLASPDEEIHRDFRLLMKFVVSQSFLFVKSLVVYCKPELRSWDPRELFNLPFEQSDCFVTRCVQNRGASIVLLDEQLEGLTRRVGWRGRRFVVSLGYLSYMLLNVVVCHRLRRVETL